MRDPKYAVLRYGYCFLAGLVFFGSSARSATLRWKFRAGETLRWEQESRSVNHTKRNGHEGKSTMTKIVQMHWTVKSVNHEGSAEMTQTLDRIKLNIESSGGNREYDSKTDKEPDDAIGKLYKAMAGAEFSFTMSPPGELSNVKVPGPLDDILRGLGAVMGKEVKRLITEPSLAQPLPRKNVSKGDRWSKTVELPIPAGTMSIEKTYQFVGPDPKADESLDVIDLTTRMKVKPAAVAAFTLEIKSQEGKGTFYFDEKAGRIVRSTITETMEALMNETFIMKTETTSIMKLVDAAKELP